MYSWAVFLQEEEKTGIEVLVGRLTEADEFRNFCLSSSLFDSKQIEEFLALAS